MKKNRIIYLILFMLSIIGISFYGGEISYGLFWLMISIPVISLFYLLLVYHGTCIYQQMNEETLLCGAKTDFYLSLRNESRVLCSAIKIVFYDDFSEVYDFDPSLEYELKPNNAIKKKTGLVCKYRGKYEVGVRKIEIYDFFRLFRFSYKMGIPYSVTVFPKIVELQKLSHVEDNLFSNNSSIYNKVLPDVIVKEYAPGDDIRRIHWQTYAKQGQLMVRNQIGEENQGITILMDSMSYSEKKEEYLPIENKVIEIVLALTNFFYHKNIPVNVFLFDDVIKHFHITNEVGFQELYETLCNIIFTKHHDFSKVTKEVSDHQILFQSKVVFMALQKFEESTEKLSEKLNEQGISVVCYQVEGYEALVNPENTRILSKTQLIPVATDANLSNTL